MKENNNMELKEDHIYSFYYNDSPDKMFHFVFKNGRPRVLLHENGPLQHALFNISETCFSHINKPTLKELGKANSRLKIILTLGLCGFIEDEDNQGILKKAYRYFYKRSSK